MEELLWLTLDELRVANWQRTKDGHKGRNPPKSLSPLKEKQDLQAVIEVAPETKARLARRRVQGLAGACAWPVDDDWCRNPTTGGGFCVDHGGGE